jgi:hypothetical protein
MSSLRARLSLKRHSFKHKQSSASASRSAHDDGNAGPPPLERDNSHASSSPLNWRQLWNRAATLAKPPEPSESDSVAGVLGTEAGQLAPYRIGLENGLTLVQ